MTLRGHRLLPLLLCLGFLIGTADGRASSPQARAKQLEGIARHPMVFFLAKGEPNACGPGCSQWIAAQGNVDAKADERFRAFLTRIQRYDLPVYFYSEGGLGDSGIKIARILREHRMAVSVGRTTPDGCREEGYPGQECRRVIEKKPEHRARLTTKGARCWSACITAMVGGSVRRFAPGVLLGVHAPGYWDEPLDTPEMRKRVHTYKVHLAELGIDPELVDLGLKTPQRRIHNLSRTEMARYGLQTQNYFETRWSLSPQPDRRMDVLKAWTRAMGAKGDEFITANVRLGCSARGLDRIAFRYRRDVPRDEVGVRWTVRLVLGAESLVMSIARTTAADESMAISAPLAALRQAAENNKIVIEESFSTEANSWARTTQLSASGLSEALGQLERNCSGGAAVNATWASG